MPTRRPRRSRRCCSETDRAILVIRDAETVVLVPPGGSPPKCPDKCANVVPHPGGLEGALSMDVFTDAYDKSVELLRTPSLDADWKSIEQGLKTRSFCGTNAGGGFRSTSRTARSRRNAK